MKYFIHCTLLSLTFLYAGNIHATSIERGLDLHDSNCIGCHAAIYGAKGNQIYTRKDRKIETLTMLKEQLKRCKNSLGTDWPTDQLLDVEHYLNSEFYHFPEEQ